MAPHEIKRYLGAGHHGDTANVTLAPYPQKKGVQQYGSYVDWRGYMNPIRDQMQCGSCYSFAAVATTEGRYAVKYGARVYLSEQQILDCARDCYGCNGGFADRALIFLKMNGAMSQASYPYYN
jgi:hypothetical protein